MNSVFLLISNPVNEYSIYRMLKRWDIKSEGISVENNLTNNGIVDSIELGELLINNKVSKFTIFDLAEAETSRESIEEALINLPAWYDCYKLKDNKRYYKLRDEKFYDNY